VSLDPFAIAAFCFGAAGIVVYFVALAMRPKMVRVLNGSGLFFSGLGLIQAAVWFRDTPPSVAWFNRDIAICTFCLAVAIQCYAVLRNRRAWDGVDRRAGPADGEPA
jgi:hypothetical protein